MSSAACSSHVGSVAVRPLSSVLDAVGAGAGQERPVAAPCLAEIVDVVDPPAPEKFQQRGRLLTRHMRLCKEAKRLQHM
eukprot:14693072-Alexandrium_andersonii.AAC.1